MIESVISNSLLILGINCLFWPGMLLFKLVKPLSKLPELLRKPLFECMICMSSVWGTVFFLHHSHTSVVALLSHIRNFDFVFLLPLIAHVLKVCGFNVILDSCIHYWRRGGNRFLKEPEQKLLG